MTRSDQKKQIAKAAFQVFGGKPSVFKYWDNQQKNNVDILFLSRPSAGGGDLIFDDWTVGCVDWLDFG